MRKSAAVQFDIFGDNYTLALTAEELEVLNRPLGDGVRGGHQLFAARLQERVRAGRLDMTGAELEEAYTKAFAYGDGTWQKYSRAVVDAGMRAGWEPSPKLRADVKARRERIEKGEEAPF